MHQRENCPPRGARTSFSAEYRPCYMYLAYLACLRKEYVQQPELVGIISFLIPAPAPPFRREAGGGEGRPHQGLGDEQAPRPGGAERAPEGAERDRQRADGSAEEEAGAAAGKQEVGRHGHVRQDQRRRRRGRGDRGTC